MDWDSQAREQALDLEHSYCVRAPAGSGKTGLLISRMLSALARVDEPEQVLAITFTRKAAFEIRERLREALESATGPAPADSFGQHVHQLAQRARQRGLERGWDLSLHPNRLRATTIDGLNRELARQMPLMAGLGAPLQPLDDPSELYRQALAQALDRHEDPSLDAELRQSLEAVLNLGQNRLDQLLQKLHQLLAERSQWAGIDPGEDTWQRGQQWLQRWTRESLLRLQSMLPTATADAWVATLAQLSQEHADSPWQALAACRAWPAAEADNTALWQCLAKSLLTQNGALRKPNGLKVNTGFPKGAITTQAKELMQEWQDHLASDAVAAFAQLLHLPQAYSAIEAQRSAQLLVVLRLALAELKLLFAQSGRCDHGEIALAAAAALANESSGAAQRMDARLQHLLVDEMQDTSRDQLQLLRMLVHDWEPGDGRSVFLVGDPQQSIYAFRQARVEGFQSLLQPGARLGPVPLRSLQLERNFRSSPALVDWCNTHMAQIFGQLASPIPFAPSRAAQTQESGEAAVHWYSCVDPCAEADMALHTIRQLVEREPEVRIGVLARSRAHLMALAQNLRNTKLSFSGVDLQALSAQAHVRDFLAGVRALHQPSDDLAWIRWLRSPALGLSWAQIDALRAQHPQLSWAQILLAEPAAPEGYPGHRWERAMQALQKVFAARQSGVALAEAARWLYRSLGQDQLLSATAKNDLDRVLEFLREHCQGGQLDDEAAFQRGLAQLWAAAPPARVELMTVHKSKGLEFDHVLLLGLGRSGRGGEEPLLGWHPDHPEAALSIQPSALGAEEEPSLYPWFRALNRQQEAAEKLRLLYVALTRAREGLHLFALPKAAAGSLGAPLAKVGQWPEPPETPAKAEQSTALEWVQHRYLIHPQEPATQSALVPPMSLGISPSQLGAAQDPAPTLSRERLRATLLGTAVHQTLEHLAIHGVERWQQQGPSMLKAIGAGLSRQGLAYADREPTLAKLETMIDTATQGQGRWILQQHPWQRNEYALAGRLDGRLVQGVIDRCFVTEQGELWLVDYKTNTAPEGLSLQDWEHSMEEHYKPQMDRYAQLLLGLVQEHQQCHCAIYLVATDSLVSWKAQSNP